MNNIDYGVVTLFESDISDLSIESASLSRLELIQKWIDGAASLGSEIIRIAGSWEGHQPTSAALYSQGYADEAIEVLEYAASKGIEVIYEFGQTPLWARPGTTLDAAFSPPANPADYANAVAYLHQQFVDAGVSNTVKAWEIWNEPNVQAFWNGGTARNDLSNSGFVQGVDGAVDQTAALEYAQLLNLSYDALKTIDPAVTVLGGSLAGTDSAYLQWLLDAGAKMDGLAVHPYTRAYDAEGLILATPGTDPAAFQDVLESQGLPSDLNERFSFKFGLEKITEQLSAAGREDVNLWITEMGFRIEDLQDGDIEDDSLTVPNAAIQAAYLSEALSIVETFDNIESFTAFQLYDARDGDFGLLNADGSLRASGSVLRDHIATTANQAEPALAPVIEPSVDAVIAPEILTPMEEAIVQEQSIEVQMEPEVSASPLDEADLDFKDTIDAWKTVLFGADDSTPWAAKGEQVDDHSRNNKWWKRDEDARDKENEPEAWPEHEMMSTRKADYIVTTAQDDTVSTRKGDDMIFGSQGNDAFDGGKGFDEVHYDGAGASRSEFSIEWMDDGTVQVSSKTFGTDVLKDIEGIWFDESQEWVDIDSIDEIGA